MRPQALALAPTVLIAALTLWSGTFHGAASPTGSLTSQSMILAFGLLASRPLTDPLALGTSGRWLLVAGLGLALLSWWASPVARAGLLPVVLLPAYLLIPAATARCWKTTPQRRIGMSWLALLLLAVSSLALVLWHSYGLPRASLPLGHHNLLAGWLILLLPLVASNGRFRGSVRWLALAATAVGVTALAATGSLLALLALTLELLLAAIVWRPLRRWLLPVALLVPLSMLPRLLDVAGYVDPSLLARIAYLKAGWQGMLARPALGWGPGSTSWTIAEFMAPIAGLHPAGQAIGDLHCTPLQVGYETGIMGLVLFLGVCAVFMTHRWRQAPADVDPTVPRAALVGLSGGLLFALGTSPLAVPALPVTAAVVAGVALGGGAQPRSGSNKPAQAAYPLLAVVLLAPVFGAHFQYEQARIAGTAQESLDWLDRARSLDPRFPLYAARRAWLASAAAPRDGTAADEARSAAALARGSAPLWLAAGAQGLSAEAPWAQEALATALRIDPLSALTAFLLMQASVDTPEAVELGARSLAGEPRLATAVWWQDHPELARAVGERASLTISKELQDSTAEPMVLALTLDQTPALSYSLFVFRRSPWPGRLAAVEIMHR